MKFRLYNNSMVYLILTTISFVTLSFYLAFTYFFNNTSQQKFYVDLKDLCENENMVYSFKVIGKIQSNPSNDSIEPNFSQQKFNCEYLTQLRQFHLSDQQPFVRTSNPVSFPHLVDLVFASDYNQYNSLRAVIASAQLAFQHSYKRIIVYDLGGLSTNATIMNELKNVCKLEIRILNFTLLPSDVRNISNFSWKILLLSDMYAKDIGKPEHDGFIYADVSTFFLEMNFLDYYLAINANRLTGFQLIDGLNRGIKVSTNPLMYTYIPLHPDLKDDIELRKTNVIVVKKTEFTRKLLKWALLCALTKECIDADSSADSCSKPQTSAQSSPSCFGKDKSLLSILVTNKEKILTDQGIKIVAHRAYNHKSNLQKKLL